MGCYSYTKTIPMEDGYDVVVAGGGPSGCAAAVAAARMGAKVLLVEALGCLGGTGTSGLVTTVGNLGRDGQMLLGGFARELYDRLEARGYISGYFFPDRTAVDRFRWEPFDAEGLKLVLDEFMQETQVEVRFFTQLVDVDRDPEELFIRGVIISNVEGLRYIGAKAFIDCTGDAILAGLANAPFLDSPKPMPPTLMALLAGVRWEEVLEHIECGQPKNQQAVVDRAVEAGYFTLPDRHVPGIFVGAGDLAAMNAGHVFDMNPFDNRSLSEGMMRGRRQAQEYTEFFKSHFPGLERLQLAATGAMMGVRDSRRILGEYCLRIDDYQNQAKFPDQVALNAQDIDLHVRDCSEEEYARFHREFFETYHYGPGEYFGIPYGVMVPKGSRNLWVSGRAVSADAQVHASIRLMPMCYTLGQAAGAAAALAIRRGDQACTLDTAELVTELRRQGAILPQNELCRQMSRN